MKKIKVRLALLSVLIISSSAYAEMVCFCTTGKMIVRHTDSGTHYSRSGGGRISCVIGL